MNQSEVKLNTCRQHQAWKNACEPYIIDIGVALTSDWLKELRENVPKQT